MKKFYKILLFIQLIVVCALISKLVSHKNNYISKNKFHATLYVDFKFNNNEKEHIIAAAYEWEIKTNRVATFDVVFLPTSKQIDLANGVLVLKTDTIDPDIIFHDIRGKNSTLGIFNNRLIPYIKLVGPRLSNQNFENVMKHELGHFMGLYHTDDPESLMYPTINYDSDNITDLDIKNFCKIYNCNFKY